MESPGEYLKREREHRGVSLASIQEATRVPMKYLAAMEANDYDALPHPTFTKGFIKNYCKCLGLDEVDATLRFEQFMKDKAHGEEASQTAKTAKVRLRLPSDQRRTAAIAAASAVVIIAVAYFGFVRKPGRTATDGAPSVKAEAPAQSQGAPQAGPQVQGQAEPSATAQSQSAKPQEQAQNQAQAEQKNQPKNTAADKAAIPQVLAKAAHQKKQEAGQTQAASAIAPVKKESQASTVERRHVLEVSASETVWVKVGIDNAPPFDVLLRAGQSVAWKAAKGFSLTVGNAGGVSVKYDGTALAPLGGQGKVVSIKLPGALEASKE